MKSAEHSHTACWRRVRTVAVQSTCKLAHRYAGTPSRAVASRCTPGRPRGAPDEQRAEQVGADGAQLVARVDEGQGARALGLGHPLARQVLDGGVRHALAHPHHRAAARGGPGSERGSVGRQCSGGQACPQAGSCTQSPARRGPATPGVAAPARLPPAAARAARGPRNPARRPHRASSSWLRSPAAAAGVAIVNMDHSTTPIASTPLAEKRVARKPPHRLVTM